MPHKLEIGTEELPMDLDFIVLDAFQKGRIVKDIGLEGATEETVHYDIKHARELVKEIYEVYARNGSRADFVKVFEKRRDAANDEINNFIDELEMKEGENLFEIINRKEKGDEITLTFKKIDGKRKADLVRSIADKLLKKLTPEQITIMLQEGVKRLNKLDDLERVNKALDKEGVETKGVRGCFKLVVDDVDLMLIP
jgi:hypothetical protein